MRSSAALIVAAGVWLQSSTPAQTPQAPAFKGRVDLVTLDVSVWDRDGRPVKGLKAADFTLLEDDKPREIVSVSEFDIPEPPPPTAAWMREATVDVESNDVTDKRLFLILVDDASFGDLKLPQSRVEEVKDVARQVIRRLGPTDLASVIFTGDNRRSQDFTADHGRLLDAVDTMTPISLPTLPPQRAASPPPRGVGLPGDKNPGAAELSLADRYSVSVLERAVEALMGAPGRRKALIDITNFSMSWAGGGHLKTRTEVMFEKAQRAGVNVYTIGPKFNEQPDYWEGSWFRRVAKETGGEWFGDLFVEPGVAERAVERIFIANSSYYMLGYTSADLAKFHNIRVAVDRPDVTVRTREKYYWPEKPKQPPPEPPPLVKGIAEILPNTGIPMRAVAMPFATPGKDDATVVVLTHLRVKPTEALKEPDETFSIAAHLFTTEGVSRGLKSRNEQVTHTGRDVIVESLSAIVAPKPGLYQVRMAAHRPDAKLHGGVYVTVDVPDFAKAPLSLSGVLVSYEEWPSIGKRDPMAELLPAEPTTSRLFSLLDRVHAYVRVYQAKGKKPVAVPVRIRIVDDHDRVVLDRTERLEPPRFTASTRGADVKVELPTASLPPAAYLLTFDATLGDAAARRELRFTVRPR